MSASASRREHLTQRAHSGMTTRRFFLLLGAIALVALAVRLTFVFTTTWNEGLGIGDQFNYHYTANGLAEGHGFQTWIFKIWEPIGADFSGHAEMGKVIAVEKSAQYPPLYQFYLAAFSVIGLDSINAHIMATILLGLLLVVMVGVLGREVGGPRLGLIAAGVAALYANFWVNDGLIMAETLGMLLAAAIVYLTYRLWRESSLKLAAGVGALIGLGALARSELTLLLPLLAIPFVMRRLRRASMRERMTYVLVMGAMALLVVSPWLIRNLTTFEKSVFLTSEPGQTLAGTNCDEAYYGPKTGWWEGLCIVNSGTYPKGDSSERNAVWQDRAFDYMSEHKGRVPVVMAARFGRMWGLFRPGAPWADLGQGQTLALDVLEGRPVGAARVALGQFYVLVVFAIGGAFVLRRRRTTLWPLVALPILASITGMLTFGSARYRAVAEIAIAVLAAVAIEELWNRRRSGQSAGPAPAPVDIEEDPHDRSTEVVLPQP
jgi:4-amino-4-deoxy-L-arabinose transferase-like glycosyltransferase